MNTKTYALRALLAVSCLASSAWAQTFSDPGFAVQNVTQVAAFQADGLRFTPDGALFIGQKNGVVRVYRNGQLNAAPFIDISGQVNTVDDRGMIGMELDPGFAQNGYVYLGFVYEAGGNTNDNGPKTSRLIRVTADPSNRDVALAGSQVIVLDGVPATGTSHTLDTLRFAPDGTMYVSNGDGTTSATTADPLALDVQNIDTYRGKILRINPDGTAPSPPQVVNPFYDGTNSIRSRVVAYGLRNPYRYDIYPPTGGLYGNDTGWNTWEEIDHYVPGGNHGWPCFEGPLPQPAYQSTFPAVCGNMPQSSTVAPLVTWDHTVGSAALGGCFYTGSVYPTQYRNSFFYSDYTASFIKRLVLDAQGNLVSNLPFATNVGVPTAMEVGPDGLLYMVDFSTGIVKRIVFQGPAAVASATPTSGYSPLSVQFTGSGSSDGLSRPLTYSWAFGDGTTSTQTNPQHTYVSSTVQTYNATLTVTNTASQSASVVVPITIGSLPPVPTITQPTSSAGVQPGAVINYAGTATDPDDGVLPPSALSWTILLHHNTHIHRDSGGTGSSGSVVVQEHGVGTYAYEIVLTATDSSGLQASTSIVIPVLPDTIPPTAPSNLQASPVGPNAISLTWTAATDNGAVDSYHVERCTGSACSNFLETGTTPDVAFTDISLLPTTTYTYRVRAVDTNGNFGPYSNTATATTAPGNTNSPGLVAAYNFDTGSGAVLADLSGNNNAGGINGATWVAGHTGGALNFDGITNVVVVPDSPTLDLTNAMTLEAWVRPTLALSSWKAILQKETDAYFLNANTFSNHVGGGGTFNNSCCSVIENSQALPLNTWTHVALTWDGSTMKLYINGAIAASTPQTGTLQVTNTPLRIGGDTYTNEFFTGQIDDLRIYNRGISAAEVSQDMSTPVGGSSGPPDTTPPVCSAGAPSGTLPAGTSQTTISLATDEAASCRYGTVANTPFASLPAVFGTTGSTSHSTLITGLSNGQSYTFYVRCQDIFGNADTSDFPISFQIATASDTTPPTVSMTAPAAGTVSGTVTVSANASDASGVAGVQFLLDGNSLGAEDTAAPYSISWNSTTAPNGAHTLSARARDTVGNAATSASVAVTVSNVTAPVGLVAAYNFDASSGTTLTDLSGNNNNGAITAATFVAGHDGNALSFNGTNAVVVVPDSASLDLTSAATFEAWLRPSQTLSNWKAVLQKETDAYFMNANTVNNVVGAGGTFNGVCCGQIEGTTGLPANTWTYLAATYDGTNLRIYVNGSLVNTVPQTGAYQVTTTPLRIGGDTYAGENFPGLIDNLRIYNRALSLTEIQTDMNTPVGAQSDTTPPVRSNGAPTGNVASGTTQTTLSLTTDEAATCRWSTTAGTAYASMTNTFSTTGGTSHATTITGLANGGSYTYYIRCQDTAGNANTNDYLVSFVVQNDTTPPTRSGGSPSGVLTAGTTQTTLSLTTNENATCRYGTVANTAYGSLPNAFSSTGGLSHSTTVTGLANGQSYTFYVRCQDAVGNANTNDFPITFSVAAPSDTTPPVRSAGAPSGTLPAYTTQTTLSLTTDENATCRWGTVAGTAYASLPNGFATTGALSHSTTVTGLTNGHGYTYYVRCQDSSGNADPDDFPITFSVAADTTPPAVTLTAPAAGTVTGTVTVSASASDVGGVAGVQFLLDGNSLGAEDTVAPYSVSWNSSTATNGTHTVSARARDVAGNQTTSTAVAVTVSNVATPPAGPVAAYSFNASSGSILADSSGNANNGNITTAVFVAGHDGNALSFNGTDSLVVIPDSPSLHLTTAMTLEAWVKPSVALNNWKAILQKEVDAYFLNADTNLNTTGSGGTFNGVCCTVVQGTSGLPVNTWTHVASTYDGATLKLYVNGVLVSSQARTGSLEVNNLALRIGGDTYAGENFPGLIDNLRIYNRALSATEIQTDMNTPVTP